MKEHPILFSAPMVRAILEGRKTQTRRVVAHPGLANLSYVVDCGDGWWGDEEGDFQARCPYGEPGDRLWVRETWAETDHSDGTPVVSYRAGGCIAVGRDGIRGPVCLLSTIAWDETPHVDQWRPSIHMPRWASRILLEVTGVRVERLQEITVSDAICEGYDGSITDPIDPSIRWYSALWEQINGPASWEANPWVWVISFRRIEGAA